MSRHLSPRKGSGRAVVLPYPCVIKLRAVLTGLSVLSGTTAIMLSGWQVEGGG